MAKKAKSKVRAKACPKVKSAKKPSVQQELQRLHETVAGLIATIVKLQEKIDALSAAKQQPTLPTWPTYPPYSTWPALGPDTPFSKIETPEAPLSAQPQVMYNDVRASTTHEEPIYAGRRGQATLTQADLALAAATQEQQRRETFATRGTDHYIASSTAAS